MKKVLFATTALVATAGVAAADVTLSGSAEMGVAGGSGMDTGFHTDIDVKFTLSGETDNGLTFGATIDLDEEGGFGSTNGGPESVFISGHFGTLTMGDTDGAFDWGMGEVPNGSGSLADDETAHAGFSGNAGFDGLFDGQIARYDHTIGGLGFAVSVELDSDPTTPATAVFPFGVGAVVLASSDPVIGLGLRYDLNLGGTELNLGFGYQTAGINGFDPSIIGVSLGANVAGLDIGVNYSEVDSDGGLAADPTHVGVGVAYSMDAFSFGVNWGRVENFGGVAGADNDGFGLSAGYDLGGGASILLGYGSSDTAGVDTNTWSFGVSMSF